MAKEKKEVPEHPDLLLPFIVTLKTSSDGI